MEGREGLELIPAVIEWGEVHPGQITALPQGFYTFTEGNLESPFDLSCMFLEETHTSSGRTCTQKGLMGLLWSDSAKHCVTACCLNSVSWNLWKSQPKCYIKTLLPLKKAVLLFCMCGQFHLLQNSCSSCVWLFVCGRCHCAEWTEELRDAFLTVLCDGYKSKHLKSVFNPRHKNVSRLTWRLVWHESSQLHCLEGLVCLSALKQYWAYE